MEGTESRADTHQYEFHRTLRPSRRAVRFLAAAIVAVGIGYGAFIILVIGAITATGCFFECSEPNLLLGVPLLVGAVTAAASVTALGWGVWVGR